MIVAFDKAFCTMRARIVGVALLLTALVSCCIVLGTPSTALAATDEWTVTFTGSSMTSDGSASINKRLSGLQPGDSATFNIKLLNDCDEEASWYMKNKVLKSMETELAKGGAYTYRLSYIAPDGTQETIISNDVVAGEGSNSAGLFDATTATGEWFFLDKLPAYGQGLVTLYVAIDPESHGNSYFDTEASLQLEFAAETASGQLVTENGGGGNKGGSGTSSDNGGFRLPGTGDMLKFGLPIVAVILALVALGISRKRSNEKGESSK